MPKCVLLEKGTTIQIDGSYSPCCQFEWQHPSPTDYKKFLELRKEKNQKMKSSPTQWIKECRWCQDDHAWKNESMRDHVNATVEGNFWELWFNNTCNLSCRMCNAWLSSTWQQNIKQNPNFNWHKEFVKDQKIKSVKFNETVFFEDLPNVRHLKLLGGEPFMIKEVKKVLEHIIEQNLAKQINLHLTTNLTHEITDWWKKVFETFKSVTVIGSMDGLEKRYEYIRPGASFDKSIKTAEYLKQISNWIKDFDFMISCTGQTLNAVQYHDIKEFWNNKGIHIDIEQMYYPDFMSYKSLHPKLRNKFKINTEIEYDPKSWEMLIKQMELQDKVHNTNFKLECAELFV